MKEFFLSSQTLTIYEQLDLFTTLKIVIILMILSFYFFKKKLLLLHWNPMDFYALFLNDFIILKLVCVPIFPKFKKKKNVHQTLYLNTCF